MDKWRLSYWREAYCSHCGARVCGNLWFLTPFSLVYMWVLGGSAFMYQFHDAGVMALVYGVAAWLVVDFLNIVLIPMSVMRDLEPPDADSDSDASQDTNSDQPGKQA